MRTILEIIPQFQKLSWAPLCNHSTRNVAMMDGHDHTKTRLHFYQKCCDKLLWIAQMSVLFTFTKAKALRIFTNSMTSTVVYCAKKTCKSETQLLAR